METGGRRRGLEALLSFYFIWDEKVGAKNRAGKKDLACTTLLGQNLLTHPPVRP